MIVSFSVGNFRSFSAEQTLNLVSSRRLAQDHEDHEVAIPGSDEKVLRTAVLYGANGAGKSNLFRALQYLRDVALGTRKKSSGTARHAFRLGTASETPSSFDLQFVADSNLYRFGFKVSDESIREEWLVRIDGSREKTLYERVTKDNGEVQVDLPRQKGKDKLQSLAVVGGPQNQSFLATANSMLKKTELHKDLRAVINWFEGGLKLISPDSSYAPLGHRLATEDDFRAFAGEFLKGASTGVNHLNVSRRELTEEELRDLIPERILADILKDVEEDEDGEAIIRLSSDTEILIERGASNRFFYTTISPVHSHAGGQEVVFKLADESDGTQRLLNLVPALYSARDEGGVYFVDEIDRSLHPKLVFDFLKFFLQSCQSSKRQIIVTSHESNLLDLELLRRDEIWFAEKDASAATHLYSLADFKVRNDLEIRKHYLQGRFGAIPFLGNLDRLKNEKGCLV